MSSQNKLSDAQKAAIDNPLSGNPLSLINRVVDEIYLASVESETDKIDLAPTLGLAGTVNSLAYRVHELEKHFHNQAYAFGNGGGNLSESTTNAFVITSGVGVDAFGAALQIHDGTVLPAIAGGTLVKWDFREFFGVRVQTADVTYRIEIWSGADPVFPGTNTLRTTALS